MGVVLASMTVRTVLAFAVIAAAAGTARADCKRAVVLAGNPALVSVVGSRLAASEIATTETAGCPSVRVELEQRGEAVHLRVTDSYQRLGERDVHDVATAAAVIESWTLDEIDDGAPPPMSASPTGAGIAASSAISDGSTLWVGTAVAACVGLGPLCAGATLRAATSTGTSQSMWQLDALATAEWPIALGGWTLSPGVLVGYGQLRVTTTHMDAHMMKFDIEVTSHQLRAGAHAMLAHPIAGRFAAFADLGADSSLVDSAATGGPSRQLVLALGVRLQ